MQGITVVTYTSRFKWVTALQRGKLDCPPAGFCRPSIRRKLEFLVPLVQFRQDLSTIKLGTQVGTKVLVQLATTRHSHRHQTSRSEITPLEVEHSDPSATIRTCSCLLSDASIHNSLI